MIRTNIKTGQCIHATREALREFWTAGEALEIGVKGGLFVLRAGGPNACYMSDVHFTLARSGLCA